MVKDYRHLSELVYKKGQSSYVFGKLRFFNVCSKMLHILHQSVLESTVFFAVKCWKSSIRECDSKKMSKPIKKTVFVLGTVLETP